MPASPPTLVNDPAMLAYPGEWHQDSCRCSTHPVCRERRDDPPVSPADTIRRVREFLVDRHRAHLPTVEDGMLSELADLAESLLAVGEDGPEQNVTEGMPPSIVRALRDPTIRVPMDDCKLADGRSLWDHLQEWRNAPSNTASGGAVLAGEEDTHG